MTPSALLPNNQTGSNALTNLYTRYNDLMEYKLNSAEEVIRLRKKFERMKDGITRATKRGFKVQGRARH